MSYSVYIKEGAISFGTDTDGEKVSFNLFFSGCSKNPKCKGCHNPELWERDESCKKGVSEWFEEVSFHAKELIEALVFLGGEPLDQPEAVYDLANGAKKLGMETWLYTGKEHYEIPEKIIKTMDVVVSGPYVEEEATKEFPASANQEITKRG